MKLVALLVSLLFSGNIHAEISSVNSGAPIRADKMNEVISEVNTLKEEDTLTKINDLIIEVNKLKAQNTLVVFKSAGSPSASMSGSLSSFFIYPGVSRDTHSGYSSATGLYNIPVEGWYRITVQQQLNLNLGPGSAYGLQIIKNPSSTIAFPFSRATSGINSNMNIPATGSEYLMVGDKIGVKAYIEGGSSSVGSAGDFLIIERLPGAP